MRVQNLQSESMPFGRPRLAIWPNPTATLGLCLVSIAGCGNQVPQHQTGRYVGAGSLVLQLSENVQTLQRPAVDFADQRIVLITMGQQSTGGYALEISALVVTEGSLTVRFVERVPGPTCINTQALTAPALALAVPRDAGSVEFEATRVVTDCG